MRNARLLVESAATFPPPLLPTWSDGIESALGFASSPFSIFFAARSARSASSFFFRSSRRSFVEGRLTESPFVGGASLASDEPLASRESSLERMALFPILGYRIDEALELVM